MAFNYQTLKNIKSESIVDAQIKTGDIDNLQVTTSKIANSAVGSSEFGTGAVSLTGNAVTGTLSTSRGGTGLSSLGSAYQSLTVNSSGSGYTYANTGLRSMQVWTGNGTWSRPSGVRYIKVCVCGSGSVGS